MYGYIYLTENLIDYKCYIGQHACPIFDVNYKGSGKLLWKAIDKYGWDNFMCQPIQWCETKEELDNAEKYWIDKCNAVNVDMFYNLVSGGTGGDKSNCFTEETRKKFSEHSSGKNNPMYGIHRIGEAAPTYGKVWTDEQKKHLSEAQKKSYKEHPEKFRKPKGFMSGEKNSIYGKKWYTNGVKNIALKPGEEIPNGFYKGMTKKHG